MSWVKEALGRGREDKVRAAEQQRADELARLAQLSDQERAKEEAKAQVERERQEEVNHLKRLLDERGVQELLEEVRAELGGEIIYKSKPASPHHSDTGWAAYGLVKSEVGQPKGYRGGGYTERTTEEYLTLGDTTSRRTKVQRHEFYRGNSTPITTTRIALGAYLSRDLSTGKPTREREGFYAIAGINDYVKVVADVYHSWSGEIPLLLRFLPRIPGLIRQEVHLRGGEGIKGDQYNLYTYYGDDRKSLLPDGRINPQRFNLEPGGREKLPIESNSIPDRDRLREFLAERLSKIA